MTIRILAALQTLAFSLSAAARPCDHLLRTPQPQITVANYQLSLAAARNLRLLGFKPRDLERFLSANNVFAIPHPNSDFASIVFEPDPEHADRGLYLTGRPHKEGFLVERVQWAHRNEEMDYFRSVAEQQNLSARQVFLARNILGCGILKAEGWVQAKLWLKHRLDLSEVKYFVETSAEPPAIDRKHSSKGRRPRLILRGRDANGKKMMAVVGGEGNCPNSLITAFEVR